MGYGSVLLRLGGVRSQRRNGYKNMIVEISELWRDLVKFGEIWLNLEKSGEIWRNLGKFVSFLKILSLTRDPFPFRCAVGHC